MSVIMWNKLGSTAQINTSEVGHDLNQNQTSPTYTDGVFTTAVVISGDNNSSNIISDSFAIPSEGTFEIFIRPDGWSWSNTSFTSGAVAFRILTISPTFGNGSETIYVQFRNNEGIHIDFYDDNGDATGSKRLILQNVVMNDGTYYHFAVTWKSSTNTGSAYVDNVQKGTNTFSYLNYSGSTNITYSLGCYTGGASNWDIDADLDNVRWHDTAETDFSNQISYEDGVPPASADDIGGVVMGVAF